jgi:hypothetical protein
MTFALEIATVPAEILEQRAPFHSIVTVSRSASAGTPRRASCRLSSRINAIALAKLARASSFVVPHVFPLSFHLWMNSNFPVKVLGVSQKPTTKPQRLKETLSDKSYCLGFTM